jgi:hypothetical protein
MEPQDIQPETVEPVLSPKLKPGWDSDHRQYINKNLIFMFPHIIKDSIKLQYALDPKNYNPNHWAGWTKIEKNPFVAGDLSTLALQISIENTMFLSKLSTESFQYYKNLVKPILNQTKKIGKSILDLYQTNDLRKFLKFRCQHLINKEIQIINAEIDVADFQ